MYDVEFEMEVLDFPDIEMGGIIDSYTKEQSDSLFAKKADFEALGLSVVDGKICITYKEG